MKLIEVKDSEGNLLFSAKYKNNEKISIPMGKILLAKRRWQNTNRSDIKNTK